MIVSIIFNTEYLKVGERIKWFLKSASQAQRTDMVIVTHESIRERLQELIKGVQERFYSEFEMSHLTEDDINQLDICYVPDEIFDEVYRKNGSQTRALLDLSNNRNARLEDFIIAYLDKALKKRGIERPDYIQFCIHPFASVVYLAEHYSCPLLPYVFSAIRKVHGYTQTLYIAHFDKSLYDNDAAKIMYDNFNVKELGFPVLNKKEILALLGKKRNLPLIPVMDVKGKYEMGIIVEGFQITPQTYQADHVTDDDLYYECWRHYDSEAVVSRVHPMKMDCLGITRRHMRNDPVTFLLSSKRFSTVQSQMLIKAALWDRVPCVLGDSLPYAFLCSKDFTLQEPMSDEKLNFILFCYFVPDCLMFHPDYWNWRKTCPRPSEIFKRHISAILKQLGYTEDLLYDDTARLEKILRGRGGSDFEVQEVMCEVSPDEIVPEYLSSKMVITYSNGTQADYYCRNAPMDKDAILSHFEVSTPSEAGIESLQLYPLDDVDGYVSLNSIAINGIEVVRDLEKTYWAKGQGYSVPLEDSVKLSKGKPIIVDALWKAQMFEIA